MLNYLFIYRSGHIQICSYTEVDFYFSPAISLNKMTRLQVHWVENPCNHTLNPDLRGD